MSWTVLLHSVFNKESKDFPIDAQEALASMVELLEQHGPQLKRPHCDTLYGSRHSNMKELRFAAADGAWRVAFAFDPKRRAVLLVGGDKSGMSQQKFYKALIRKADARFGEWLEDAE